METTYQKLMREAQAEYVKQMAEAKALKVRKVLETVSPARPFERHAE